MRDVQWHDGKEWDFMIDVDTEGGALKLPLNRGEDPYDVADRFLQKHNLPASYMQQVADFVAQTLGDTGVRDCTMRLLCHTSLHPLVPSA